jgi:O-antigen/teichoic acid export membrane protein
MSSIAIPRLPSMRAAFDLLMLYISKAGAILFGVLILPQFSRLLGAGQFGVIASIFALQSLLLVLDLGMATIVGREFATAQSTPQDHRDVLTRSRKIIFVFYLVLALVALLLSLLGRLPLTALQTGLALALFYTLTLQNIGQAAILARREYLTAGVIQIFGVIFRGVASLLAVIYIRSDLTTFLVCQVLCAIVHALVTDRACRKMLGETVPDPARTAWRACLSMAAAGRSLMVYGFAGAAVMQLDKVIISSFLSPAAMTPYYLATSLCLTPLSVLAGPVAQYFQPRVVRAVTDGDEGAVAAVMAPFVRTLVLATVLPTAILWFARDPLIALWLRDPTHARAVSEYCAVLMPGIAAGALSYVPYTVLIARQDFHFQSVASAILTTATLALTAAAAAAGSIMAVCWIYAGYHTSSTIVSWSRCIYLQSRDSAGYATQGAALTVKTLAMLALPLLVCASGMRLFLHSSH